MRSRARERRGRRGNCYVTVEALFHLLGGSAAGYKPHTVQHEGDVHWYLVHTGTYAHDRGMGRVDTAVFEHVIDPTASQFKTPPPYHLGRGRGFLTKEPSKRARALMEKMLWQDTTPRSARGAAGRTSEAANNSSTSGRSR